MTACLLAALALVAAYKLGRAFGIVAAARRGRGSPSPGPRPSRRGDG